MLSNKGSKDLIAEACYQGDMNLVLSLFKQNSKKGIKIDKDQLNTWMSQASSSGHKDIVLLMIKKGADNWNRGLGASCCGGHKILVSLMIAKGANDWQGGLEGACHGGKIETAEMMIEIAVKKGVHLDWNNGLYRACYGGHIETVELMIKKGAKDWNLGAEGAHYGKHKDLVRLMILKGADINKCRDLDPFDIEYLIGCGFTNFGQYASMATQCIKKRNKLVKIVDDVIGIQDVTQIILSY